MKTHEKIKINPIKGLQSVNITAEPIRIMINKKFINTEQKRIGSKFVYLWLLQLYVIFNRNPVIEEQKRFFADI